MSKNKTTDSAIASDSVDCLDDVKKGKARKFVLISKGTKIVSLVVFKKGTFESGKKQAREAGTGEICYGVVDGKGQDIRFVLSRSDGFVSAPVRSAVLKSFLAESAELSCKPYFEVVDAAPLVLDEDNPLVARFLQLQDRALAACESHPDQAPLINTLCRQIGGFLDQDQSDQAVAKLEALEALLGGLSSGPAPPVTDDSATEAKLVDALKKLQPLLAKSIELQPDRRGELLGAAANVRDEIRNKQFADASRDLVALGQLLKSIMSATRTEVPPAPQTPTTRPPASDRDGADEPAALFTKRLKALLPAIKGAAGTRAGNEAHGLASDAGEFARDRDFDTALQLLGRAEVVLRTAIPAESPTEPQDFPSLWAAAKSAWQNASELVDSQITRLQAALKETQDSELQSIAEFGLNAITAGNKVALLTAIREVDQSSGVQLVEAAANARDVIEDFSLHLESDERVQACDHNSFEVPMSIRATLTKALAQMDVALDAVKG